ncbi:hypothetical protein A2U01_0101080 [Trifolium medium]|uniref:Uncharacterized protein n=1 Tax=Trifolium medium TaxID=97028 RepID=A0A392UXT1_9FABA|nr:hypothetical protein [Trifolium medium]
MHGAARRIRGLQQCRSRMAARCVDSSGALRIFKCSSRALRREAGASTKSIYRNAIFRFGFFIFARDT